MSPASGDVYVLDAVRTPIGRYRGGLANVRPDDLAAGVVRALVDREPEIGPGRIDDVWLGDANGAGEDNRNVARMAVLLAGLPVTVPATTVNACAGRAWRRWPRPPGPSWWATPGWRWRAVSSR